MEYQKLIGHKPVTDYLEQAHRLGSLAHAYLLRGPKSVGKAAVVQAFLTRLFCAKPEGACGRCPACMQVKARAHPDVWWLEPLESKSQVSIDQVRELIRFAQLTSLTAHWRVVVIPNVAELTTEAASALLKVLEEPPAGVVFFLLDHHQDHTLSTLQSRCVLLELGLVPTETIAHGLTKRGVPLGQAAELAQLASGRPGVALTLFTNPTSLEQTYTQARVFLSLFQSGAWSSLQRFVERHGQVSAEGGPVGKSVLGPDTVGVWLEVARDALFMRLGLGGAVRYQKLAPEVQLVARRSLSSLLSICQTLRLGQQKLMAKANPRLTFEWLGLTLPRL